MSSHVVTTKAEMLSSFPPPVAAMTSETTLRKLLRVLIHMMACAQGIKTDISPLNYLFLVLSLELYANQTQEQYPQTPLSPGVTPNYAGANDAATRAQIKASFDYDTMRHENCAHMNAVLVDRFLSLILFAQRQ